ncbi:MAG: universal stress protein [Candidatus Binatia bacterium]
MLKSILLALHDTEAAAEASAMALDLAERHMAEITGMSVIDVPFLTGREAIPIGGSHFKFEKDASLLQQALDRSQKLRSSFAEECRRRSLAFQAEEYDGDPYSQLLGAVTLHDLVVIGRDTTFHSGPAVALAKPVSELLRRNPRPLIVTCAEPQAGDRVVIGYDGSVPSMRSLHVFVLLGLCSGWKPLVVSIGQSKADSQALAAVAVEFLARHGVAAEAQGIASEADPSDILLAECQSLHARLLVMGAFGNSGWRESIVGSSAKRLIKAAQVHLFVHH